MALATGVVSFISGQVKAVSAAGVERELSLGSLVYEGETVLTVGDNSRVMIDFGGQGQIALGRDSVAVLDNDVFPGGSLDEQVQQVEEIQQALANDPNFDPNALAPTAAGAQGGSGSSSGIPIFIVHNFQETEVTSGVTTNTDNAPFGATVDPVSLLRLPFVDGNAPILTSLGFDTDEDVPFSGTLVAIDNEGTSYTFALESGSDNGSVVVLSDGTFSYTPNDNYNGDDSFVITLTDNAGNSASYTVTVTVVPVNDLPEANDDSGTTDENGVLVIDVLANDTDIDLGDTPPDTLSIDSATIVSYDERSSTGGSVTIVDNELVYDPEGDFDYLATGQTATVLIEYTMSDEAGAQSSAVATVTIVGTNDTPVAIDDSASTFENQSLFINALANDTDADWNDNPLNFSIVSAEIVSDDVPSQPQNPQQPPQQPPQDAQQPTGTPASVTIVANQLLFDPGTEFDYLATGETETVTIEYTMSDDEGEESTASVEVTVIGTNDRPIPLPDAARTLENQTITLNVLANDTDVDNNDNSSNFSLDFVFIVPDEDDLPTIDDLQDFDPQQDLPLIQDEGSVSIVNNQLVYNPGSDFDYLATGETATVTVGYVMSDNEGAANVSFVTIVVTGTNDTPVANVDEATVSEDNSVTIDVLANDTDADHNDNNTNFVIVSASVVDDQGNSVSNQGTVAIVNGELVYTPGSEFDYLQDGESETVTISYTMADDEGEESTSTVIVTVEGANDAPSSVSLSGSSVDENAAGAVIGTLSTSDIDDDSGFTYTVSDDRFEVVNGELKLKDGESLDYETENEITVTVTSTDAGGLSTSEDFTVTVNNVNEAPTLQFVSGTSLIVNGSFEADEGTVDVATGSWTHVASIAGWETNSEFEIWDQLGGKQASDGDQFLELDYAGAVDAIWQTVPAEDGIEYLLTFDAADRDANHGDGFQVLWNGVVIATIDTPETWTTYSFTVTGTAGDDVLTFQELPSANDSYGTHLDNISLVEQTTSFTVAEDAGDGVVVAQALGTDPDKGDTLTYSLTDDATGLFEIDPTTGEITVNGDDNFDFETTESYTLTVRVTDAEGLFDEQTITVDVTDVNEAPEAMDDVVITNIIGEDIDIPGAALASNDTDVDGDSLTATDVTVQLTSDTYQTISGTPNVVAEVEQNYYIDVNNKAVQDVSFAMTATDTAAVIVTGGLGGIFNGENYNDAFGVTLLDGESLSLSVEDNIIMEVYDTDGNLVASSSDGSIDGVTGTGDYIVKVYTNDASANYNLEMIIDDVDSSRVWESVGQWVEGTDTSYVDESGVEPLASTINIPKSDYTLISSTMIGYSYSGNLGHAATAPTYNDAFEFVVGEGESLNLDFQNVTAADQLYLKVFLVTPDGLVEVAGYESVDILAAGGDITLDESGTYVVKVWTNETAGADYEFNASYDLSESLTTETTYTVSDGELSDEGTVTVVGQIGSELIGTDADEIFIGGGDDTYTGGGGADTFIITGGDDVITDYNAAEGDVLDLSDVIDITAGKTIDDYLTIEDDGEGNVELHVLDETGTDTGTSVTLDTVAYSDGMTTQDVLNQVTVKVDDSLV